MGPENATVQTGAGRYARWSSQVPRNHLGVSLSFSPYSSQVHAQTVICYSSFKPVCVYVPASLSCILLKSAYVYTHTSLHTCVHTCMHTHTHTYVHIYAHTYIHTYIHTYMLQRHKGTGTKRERSESRKAWKWGARLPRHAIKVMILESFLPVRMSAI